MNSSRVLILAKESETIRKLVNMLTRRGYVCNIVSSEEELADSEPADLLLIETENGLVDSVLEDMTQRIKQDRNIHIIILADKECTSGHRK